ncbi:hypothetical protein BpHYR1_047813 [Brachionus plicatilis]|uniref:Uncharacterized protein n=1 Tax=Brachionus plicatilis TaxID=10195 RepID=A0A3M7R065_BRAPC|nr:hypothetical protein BpHYR1_047813 [Brachionus plicatilis]
MLPIINLPRISALTTPSNQKSSITIIPKPTSNPTSTLFVQINNHNKRIKTDSLEKANQKRIRLEPLKILTLDNLNENSKKKMQTLLSHHARISSINCLRDQENYSLLEYSINTQNQKNSTSITQNSINNQSENSQIKTPFQASNRLNSPGNPNRNENSSRIRLLNK